MKLNPMIIAEKFDITIDRSIPSPALQDISAIRLFSEDSADFPLDIIYILRASDIVSGIAYENSVFLVYANGLMLIPGQSIEAVTNELLSVFDYYNQWETALWDTIHSDTVLQKIVELSQPVFGALICIANIDGRILANNKVREGGGKNEWWDYLCETGMLPLAPTSSPILSSEGEILDDWTTVPRLYALDVGTYYIGAYLKNQGEPVALIYMQEYSRKLTQGDCQLASTLCKVLSYVINSREDLQLLTIDSALTGFIEKRWTAESLQLKLGRNIPVPWKLVAIRNIASSAHVLRRRRLLGLVKSMKSPNTAFIYQQEVLAIIPESNAKQFLHELYTIITKKYYAIGISLPFSRLTDLSSRYRQAVIALGLGDGETHDCSRFAFKQLLKTAKEANSEAAFLHPALQILKDYDTSHNTEFYKTLYEYLRHERNKVETAKFLHLHRNSLTYRLTQIEELTGLDLHNSDERNFVLLSFLIQDIDEGKEKSN
jgi:hypothetical protein